MEIKLIILVAFGHLPNLLYYNAIDSRRNTVNW